MVPRAWTSLIRILIALFLIGTYQGIHASPAQAGDEDNCQSAYGKTLEQIPGWLESASDSMDLTSNRRYDLLAGKLLSTGLVDGSVCPAMGLDSTGAPNGCGLTLTRDSVFTWQNLYNEPILRISEQEHIPPKVVKALIGVESQFWPGADWKSGEIGLAQLTAAGADMILLNRRSYYAQVCIQVFGNDGCAGPYFSQTGNTKQLLIGQVLQNSNAICASCAGGVDIERGELAIESGAGGGAQCQLFAGFPDLHPDHRKIAGGFHQLRRFLASCPSELPFRCRLYLQRHPANQEPRQLEFADIRTGFCRLQQLKNLYPSD